ncbi:MAG: hypothetical protein IKO48_07225 [Elusimicrobia bacterium]|nr:hypothetical protein [Elusimicrobiota bacterium]
MVKKYAVIEVKQGDCIFRQFDTFEGDYFCNREKVWLDSKNDCKGCKYKDGGETVKQIKSKIKTALAREKNFSCKQIKTAVNAVMNFMGTKE